MNVLKPTEGYAGDVRSFRFSAKPSTLDMSARGQSDTFTKTQIFETFGSGESDNSSDKQSELAHRVSKLEALLDEQSTQAERAVKEAFKEGRNQGRQEAQRLDQERLERLEEALIAARLETLKAFEGQSRLAINIAQATLKQILGDQSAFASLVPETVTYWKTKLANATILKVRVSKADFSNERALQRLGEVTDGVDIVIDKELGPGSCLFDLQLGSVDASIPVQSRLAEEFLEQATTSTLIK